MTDAFRDDLSRALGQGYSIDRELTGGGMSRVFVGTEHGLNRTVVIKVLRPDLAADVNRERFRREIMLVAQLNHPHIVPVLSAGQSGELLWYSMPFVEGESLRDALKKGRTMSAREVSRVLHDVLDALDYAHTRGVVHRDIKPGNILRHRSHSLVTDFGVAKALSAAMPHSGTTSAGMAIGTPAYMAPEQIAADPKADHRMDLYAVGLLAYELLTGTQPFAASSPQETLAAQLTRMPTALDRVRDDLPPALVALVTKLLAKNPDDRPASAAAALEELDAVTTPSDATPARTWSGSGRSLARSGRGRALIAAGGLLVAALAAWGIFRSMPDGDLRTDSTRAADSARPAVVTRDSVRPRPDSAKAAAPPVNAAPGAQKSGGGGTPAATTRSADTKSKVTAPATSAATPTTKSGAATKTVPGQRAAPTARPRFVVPRKVAVIPARFQTNRPELAATARALTDSLRRAVTAAGYTLASDGELVQLLAQPGSQAQRAAAEAAGIGAVIGAEVIVRATEVRAQAAVTDIWRNMQQNAAEGADLDKPLESLGVVRDIARALDRVAWRRRDDPKTVIIFDVDNVTGVDTLDSVARAIADAARDAVARDLPGRVIRDSAAVGTKDVLERREVAVRTGAGALVAMTLSRFRRDSVALRFAIRDLSEETNMPTVETRLPLAALREGSRPFIAQLVESLKNVNWGPRRDR